MQHTNAIREYAWRHHWDVNGPVGLYGMLWVRHSLRTTYTRFLCSLCLKELPFLQIQALEFAALAARP